MHYQFVEGGLLILTDAGNLVLGQLLLFSAIENKNLYISKQNKSETIQK